MCGQNDVPLRMCFRILCFPKIYLWFSKLEGVTGLNMTTLSDNWSSDYQPTNNAGVPDPKGYIYWDFKYVLALFLNLLIIRIKV